MAKKNSFENKLGSLSELIGSFDNSTEIISNSQTAKINDYIDTGNYLLNASMTGSLFKGVPCGRVLILSGEPGTGKTYLTLSVCRNAQKKGYTPIYMDSEGSIDVEFIKRLGCDPDNFMIKQVTTISEVSTFIANLTKKLLEMPDDKRSKIILVLDSLGNLTSDKELTNTIDGNKTRDMTKQQEIKALFRTNATALSKLGIPFIVTSHMYQTQDLFSKQVVSGGSGLLYNGSLIMMLSQAKLDDKSSDAEMKKKTGEFTKTGIQVTAKPIKSRFTIPQKVKFQIPYFKAPNPYIGLESYIKWENCGILRGKMLTEKEYSKLTDLEKMVCAKFELPDGKTAYAQPKDTSRNIVVNHLGCEVPIQELWSSKVLTDDILRSLDENVIRPSFELPSNLSNSDIDEFLEMEE